MGARNKLREEKGAQSSFNLLGFATLYGRKRARRSRVCELWRPSFTGKTLFFTTFTLCITLTSPETMVYAHVQSCAS